MINNQDKNIHDHLEACYKILEPFLEQVFQNLERKTIFSHSLLQSFEFFSLALGHYSADFRAFTGGEKGIVLTGDDLVPLIIQIVFKYFNNHFTVNGDVDKDKIKKYLTKIAQHIEANPKTFTQGEGAIAVGYIESALTIIHQDQKDNPLTESVLQSLNKIDYHDGLYQSSLNFAKNFENDLKNYLSLKNSFETLKDENNQSLNNAVEAAEKFDKKLQFLLEQYENNQEILTRLTSDQVQYFKSEVGDQVSEHTRSRSTSTHSEQDLMAQSLLEQAKNILDKIRVDEKYKVVAIKQIALQCIRDYLRICQNDPRHKTGVANVLKLKTEIELINDKNQLLDTLNTACQQSAGNGLQRFLRFLFNRLLKRFDIHCFGLFKDMFDEKLNTHLTPKCNTEVQIEMQFFKKHNIKDINDFNADHLNPLSVKN